MRGAVTVDGVTAKRAGQTVSNTTEIRTDLAAGTEPYVGRGAHKLIDALNTFGIDPAGAHALDVGASTGGFTDVLLRRGAAQIVALDVGTGQLAGHLAADHRVVVMDGVNARDLRPEMLPIAPDLVVVDVSFISLRIVLPAVLSCASEQCQLVALVKPQFEVGRAAIGKGGIVRNEKAILASVDGVAGLILAEGWAEIGRTPSPISGADGNREWLLAAARPPPRRPRDAGDVPD